MKSNVVAALASVNEAQQAELDGAAQGQTRENPLPPDGKYDIALLEGDDGYDVSPYNKDGFDTVIVNAFFRIVGGERDGRRLDQTFFGWIDWSVAKLFDIVTLLSGEKPNTLTEAVELLAGCGGRQLSCTIKTKEKNGEKKKYVNFSA